MHVSSYKELIMWQRAFEVTKLIVYLFRKLPTNSETNIFRSQIIRAAASIGANIAEGFGRYGKKEYSRFLQISLGSANETEYWLLIIKDIYSQFDSEINQIINKNSESIKMIASTIKTFNSN